MKQHTDPSITEDHWYISVPSDWSERPIHTFGTNNKRKNEGLREKNLLSLSYGNLVRRDIEDATGLTPASYETYQIVDPGDVVVRLLDLQNDKNSLRSGLVTETGIVTSAYVGLKINKEVGNPRFVAYSLRALDHQKYLYALGGGVRQSLNFDDFSKIKLPIPSLEEQSRIADFLDVETEEIDRVVGVLDELIEDLEARKTRIIADALDSSTDHPPTTISMVADVSLGKTYQGEKKRESEIYCDYLRAASIQPNGELVFDGKRMWASPSEIESYEVRKGDVLVVEGGAGYGRSATVKSDMKGWIFQNHVMRIRPRTGSEGRFIDYTIRNLHNQGFLDVIAVGSTIPAISSDRVRRLAIKYPSLDVQRRTADYLDDELAKIDRTKNTASVLRDELLARRKALITEYVTGQKRVEE